MQWREHIARYGSTWFPGPNWARWTFGALFVIAAILRFWNLPHIAYTHDELSALARIYPSLWKTIQHGVIELDTHPPGVHVFEWAWTRVFGIEAGAVKAPFIVLSLAAIFLLYRTAIAWTSAGTALMVTALMATMQYTVLYGQIARPYAIGLFTIALLADRGTAFLARGSTKALIGAGVAVVLSAYAHHFSLLLAGIMVVSFFPLVTRPDRKRFLIMCGCCVLLYLPNVPIFLKQLSYGGLAEWLAPPDGYWLGDFARWLTHYSLAFLSVIVTMLFVSVSAGMITRIKKSPAIWLLPLWGILPLAIGWAYSVYRAPVLQYSVVLFSFPFLLMALFAGLGALRPWSIILSTAVVAFVSIHSLVSVRQHYSVLYQGNYASFVEEGHRLQAAGTERVLVLFDAAVPQIRFHVDRLGLSDDDLTYHQIRGITNARLDSLLTRTGATSVLLGVSNGSLPERPAQVQARFPFLGKRTDMVEGQLFEFHLDAPETTIRDRALIAEALPGQKAGNGWDIEPYLPLEKDSLGAPIAWNFGEREYGLGYAFLMDTAMFNERDRFEMVVDVEVPSLLPQLMLVTEIWIGDSLRSYREQHLDGLAGVGSYQLVSSASRGDVQRGDQQARMKSYVYNPGKLPIRISSLRVYRRLANPIQYALIRPIPWMPNAILP